MVDAEASRYRGDSHSSSSDSLQEVLFKDPPVKPPPVAVNMCDTLLLTSRFHYPFLAFLFVFQEGGRGVWSCCARMLAAAP